MLIQRDDLVAAAFGRGAMYGNSARPRARTWDWSSTLSFSCTRTRLNAAEMEVACPEVLTLQVPADPDEIPTWLKHVWAFDRVRASGEICCDATPMSAQSRARDMRRECLEAK